MDAMYTWRNCWASWVPIYQSHRQESHDTCHSIDVTWLCQGAAVTESTLHPVHSLTIVVNRSVVTGDKANCLSGTELIRRIESIIQHLHQVAMFFTWRVCSQFAARNGWSAQVVSFPISATVSELLPYQLMESCHTWRMSCK